MRKRTLVLTRPAGRGGLGHASVLDQQGHGHAALLDHQVLGLEGPEGLAQVDA